MTDTTKFKKGDCVLIEGFPDDAFIVHSIDKHGNVSFYDDDEKERTVKPERCRLSYRKEAVNAPQQ